MVVGWLVVGLGVLAFAILVPEWWAFLVRRDFSRATQYPFGTEQGWSYSNPVVYAWSSLITGVLTIAMAVLLRFGLVRKTWRPVGAALVLIVAWIVTDHVCAGINWSILDRFAQVRQITG